MVLVTNDDGIEAPGIRMLAEKIAEMGRELVVCAPDSCTSAMSMAVSVNRPVKVTREECDYPAFRVFGSSVDCVKLVMSGKITPKKPEIILSGVNMGLNVARDPKRQPEGPLPFR